jgi:hypothetical protein
MKEAVFYLVVKDLQYKALFRNVEDAEMFVDKYGGCYETISTYSYKNFDEYEKAMQLANTFKQMHESLDESEKQTILKMLSTIN